MEKVDFSNLMNCRSIAKIWYGMAIFILQIYVHYDQIHCYLEFKKQSNDPRYGQEWSDRPLVFCLIAMMMSFALLPFFVYTCLIKTGNLTNDGVQLGQDDNNFLHPTTRMIFSMMGNNGQKVSCCRKFKYYISPSCQVLHFISAFLLLIPHMFLESERFRNSALGSEYSWTSDLHVLFNIHDIQIQTIVRQYDEVLRFPIATLNFIIASIFLSLYSSAVFWKSSKSFATLVTLFDIIIGFGVLILDAVLTISFRYYASMDRAESEKKNIYTETQCCLMFVVAVFCFLMCRNLIFEFGVRRFIINQNSFHQLLDEVRVPSISKGLLRNSREFKDRIRGQFQSFWINGFGFLLWVVEAGCLIPLACYFISIFWLTTKIILVFGFISTILILFTWFAIWMTLSIKHDWMFKVCVQSNIQKSEAAYPGDAIYTCFHDNRALGNCTGLSTDKKQNRLLDEDYMYADHKKPDLYQLFRVPTEFMGDRVRSTASIASHNIDLNYHPVAETLQKQNANGRNLHEIDENHLLDDYSERTGKFLRESQMSPCVRMNSSRDLRSPKNFLLLNSNSQADSDYHSNHLKHYSHESLRSMPMSAKRNGNFNDLNIVETKIDNLPYKIDTNSGMYDGYLSKDQILDDNTDISTDFSDQNTNSSGVEVKINSSNKLKYYPLPFLGDNQAENRLSDIVFVQQTGV